MLYCRAMHALQQLDPLLPPAGDPAAIPPILSLVPRTPTATNRLDPALSAGASDEPARVRWVWWERLKGLVQKQWLAWIMPVLLLLPRFVIMFVFYWIRQVLSQLVAELQGVLGHCFTLLVSPTTTQLDAVVIETPVHNVTNAHAIAFTSLALLVWQKIFP